MQNIFDPRALAGAPWSPMALWQANMQMMSNFQQAWLQMCMPGGRGAADSVLAMIPGVNGHWAAPDFMASLMPFMPKIEATVTPLKREGKLAGAEDASRVTMRMTVPGLGSQGAAEILLVDAVVARAAGKDALRLGNGDLPANQPGKD